MVDWQVRFLPAGVETEWGDTCPDDKYAWTIGGDRLGSCVPVVQSGVTAVRARRFTYRKQEDEEQCPHQ